MASPVIKIKRSSVQNNAPTAAQLELGELALNTYDGKLFTEINDGTVSIVEIGGHLQHLAVSGISTFTGNIDANGNLDVDGQTDLDVLNVSDTATFAGNIDANGALDVDGQTDLDVLNVSDTATFTGDLKIDNLSKSLQVGNISGDNYVDIRQVAASSYKGFSLQHNNASVIANLQGSTNQYIVLGDNNNGNGGTIFGIAQSQAGTDYQYLTLSAAGNLSISNNGTFGGNITATGADINGNLDVSGTSTLNDDVTFTGSSANLLWDKSNDRLEFAEGSELRFDMSGFPGAGLQISNDGATAKIESNDLQFESLTGNDNYITCVYNGSVKIGYNDDWKFETTNTGVEVYGNVVATGADINGDIDVDGHTEVDNLKSVGIATFTNNAIHANVYSTGISTISGFRFPTSDGDEDQALVTDGNGSLSFKTLSGGGGGAAGAATTISSGITTATQGQTVFSTPHPHNDGSNTYSTQVFVNGVKQRPQGAGSTKDFTTSSNSTITFEEGITAGSEVVSVVYFGHTIDEEYFTATQGQVLFPLTGSLSAQKNFRVFVNGVKQRNGSDYGVAAPVSLVVPCAEGSHVEIVCDNAEDAFVATDQQTNFTPTSTDITEDNMQVYVNGIQLFSGIDYTIGSPSVTFTDATGLTVGDEVDVCIRRTA